MAQLFIPPEIILSRRYAGDEIESAFKLEQFSVDSKRKSVFLPTPDSPPNQTPSDLPMKLPAAPQHSINEMKTFFGEVKFAFETKAKLCKQEEVRLRANPTVELIRKSLCGP